MNKASDRHQGIIDRSPGVPASKEPSTTATVSLTFAACRMYIRPMFFLLLLITGVTFSVFAITNGSVAIKFIEMTTRLQSNLVDGGSAVYQQSANYSDVYSQPLLTLFTTFRRDPNRWRHQWNVIHNWAHFQPKVRVILFDDDTEPSLLSFAHDLNWTIFAIPKKSSYGIPVLKEMFNTCQKFLPNSIFYGFANGDILFDEGLTETLEVVSSYLNPHMEETLIVGRRTNFNVRGRRLTTLKEVRRIALTEGKLFRTDAEDYFFLAHNKFPWQAVPDLVIGRPSVDNFLVATAIKHGVSVIDATKTLLALHQTGYDGEFSGFKNVDAQYNKQLVGEFDYHHGLTTSSTYFTQYSGRDGHIELWRRPGATHKAAQLMILAAVVGNASQEGGQPTDRNTLDVSGYHGPLTSHATSASSSASTLKSSTSNGHAQSQNNSPAPNHSIADTEGREDPGLEQNVIDEILDSEDEDEFEDLRLGLLTLFTVFTSDPTFHEFHTNVLRNWATYHPDITTVVFLDSDHPLSGLAKQLNWTVLPTIPQTGASLPLKKMFLQIEYDLPKSTFYGYIKGDLLFGSGLVKTVREVAITLDNLDSALLVGSKFRTVVPTQRPLDPWRQGQTSTNDIIGEIQSPSTVDSIIRSKNTNAHSNDNNDNNYLVMTTSDLDENFVIAHFRFPWQHMPDVVLGQSVYDNYLVALALRYDFAVIDATQTLTALEQITKDSALQPSRPDDFDPNLLAALDYSEGHVTSAQFESTYDILGNVRLWRRRNKGEKPVLVST